MLKDDKKDESVSNLIEEYEKDSVDEKALEAEEVKKIYIEFKDETDIADEKLDINL